MAGQIQVSDELTTGLQARERLEGPRPHVVVEWIAWDSGFRGTDLRVDDHIVAVGDKPVAGPRTVDEARAASHNGIGRYAEHQRWQELGLTEGDALTLTIERRAASGVGWERTAVVGPLMKKRRYFTEDWNDTLGPDGPRGSAYDNFQTGPWRTWYEERLVKQLIRCLQVWSCDSFGSRQELAALLEFEARVRHCVEKYPGPFASMLEVDFRLAVDSLTGRPHVITEENLRYRKADAEKVARVQALAQEAWAAFQQAHASEILPELPAVHPIRDDRTAITGKLVRLPTVGNRDWFGEAGRYFLGANSGANWFFVDVDAAPAMRMREAARRYARLVHPNIRETFTVIGRLLPDPRIVYWNGRSMIGFQVDPVAALAGDAMFVDVTTQDNGTSLFEGEAELLRPAARKAGPEASPAEVMTAFFEAIKDGDETGWRGCYATWSAFQLDSGRVKVSPYSPRASSLSWEDARRRVLNDVYGIEVVWIGEPYDLPTGDFEGAPSIQEVEVQVEHVGLFEGEYRGFASPYLHRHWRLQRLNGSPWRISTDHGF